MSKIKGWWDRFQRGPSISTAKVVEFPTFRRHDGVFRRKYNARVENLRDEMAKLERRLSEIEPHLNDREKRKESNSIIERLVKIKYEIDIRTGILERQDG